jgi:exosortase O
VAILAMALVYAPRPQTGLSQPPPAWEFPAEIVTEPMPLKPDEIEWLTRGGAESADRRRFEWRDITGSMILITSTTWRAQHRPERCFEVYGLSVDDSRTHLVTPDFPVGFVSLGDDDHVLLSATYWFQSVDRTTDDYATRIWADLAPERERWVLVTILFDSVHDPHAADMQAFYIALHDTVARSLEGGPSS